MATTVYRPSASSTGDVSITGDISASGTINTVGISSAANATAMTIDSDENVGIGTTNPTGKFQVGLFGLLISEPLNDFVSSNGSTRLFVTDGTAGGLRNNEHGHLVLQARTTAPRDIIFSASGSEDMTLDSDGIVTIKLDTIRIEIQKTPASASAKGTKGDIVHDTGFIYVCTATDTWKRIAIATW